MMTASKFHAAPRLSAGQAGKAAPVRCTRCGWRRLLSAEEKRNGRCGICRAPSKGGPGRCSKCRVSRLVLPQEKARGECLTCTGKRRSAAAPRRSSASAPPRRPSGQTGRGIILPAVWPRVFFNCRTCARRVPAARVAKGDYTCCESCAHLAAQQM